MNIAVVGIGNLGWNLCYKLHKHGLAPSQMVGNPAVFNQLLATKMGAKLRSSIEDLDPSTDLVFLCLPDAQLQPAARLVPVSVGAVVHCSGSTPLAETGGASSGVFYPLLTFTKGVKARWHQVPVFIESTDSSTSQKLNNLAVALRLRALQVSFEQRRAVHLAGVVGSNFTNHLLSLCDEWLRAHQLPLDVMAPLVNETVRKAFEIGPAKAQTGPARRGDTHVVNQHIELLRNSESLRAVYSLLTAQIQTEYKS